jgi:hypothetical protein
MKISPLISRFLLFFAGASLCLLFNACGYHAGYLMHPQVKTIAIAPVKNETLIYNVPAILRNKLAEAFMREGSLKIRSLREADCILYARVTKITYRETTPASFDNEITFRPMEWRIWMTVEFTVIIPGNKEPLIKKQTVLADSLFQVQADLFVNRQRGVAQCSWHLARRVVQNVTEAW